MPGPGARHHRQVASRDDPENLTELDEATARKVLYETASKVYHLPVPADRDQRFSSIGAGVANGGASSNQTGTGSALPQNRGL